MEFEWDEAKSERNRIERGLPFRLAVTLFKGTVVERVDERRPYGEIRVRAVGVVDDLTLCCIYTDRGEMRRIISLRVASRRERRDYRAGELG
jgi:uncharacterized DUF497 family protein